MDLRVQLTGKENEVNYLHKYLDDYEQEIKQLKIELDTQLQFN